MYLIKKAIVKSFAVFVMILGRLSLAVSVFVLGAQALAQLENLRNYTILFQLHTIEHFLEKPIDKVLHANLPMIFGGIDGAPFLIAAAFFVLWAVCEAEIYRLSLHSWELDQKKGEDDRRKAALQAEMAAKADFQRRQKEADERAKARNEEIARRERERHELERLALERETTARIKAAEERAAAELAQQQAPAPVPPPQNFNAPAGSREQLLEIYAQTKKSLEDSKKNLSFLAIDVVNSTGMKQGEDAALAERDFRQYKKLVERIITAHKGLKAAWTPDGVMICFASVQNAVQAAQDIIKGLDHFNREVKTIKAPFKVRCGINAGKVLFDDTVPMEEMTDRSIDIAGHMQKYAEANTIYIGSHAIEGMRTEFGFRPAQKQVDGCDVYEWRADAASEGQPAVAV